MSDSDKRAAVECIFDYVERNLDYLILRNYETLPEDEGHDIDLLIRESDYRLVQPLIEELKSRFGVTVFLRDDYDGLYSHCIVFDKAILHLDFFTSLQWNHTPLIPTEELLQRKTRYKERFWIISKDDLGYYCWIHDVRSRGDVKEKYARMAREWEEKWYAESGVDLRRMPYAAKRRYMLRRIFFSGSLLKLLGNTVHTLFSKVRKVFRMDGRLYVSDDLLSPLTVTCRRFCSCRQRDISDAERFTLLRCLRYLYGECSVGISTAKWKTLKWRGLIPGIYIIRDAENVLSVVRNIYRNKSI